MSHSNSHILETDEYDKKTNNSHTSIMTSSILGPTALMNGQPTRIDQQHSNSRFPDYALQQNSAITTNSRISIPHPLASVHWDAPLTSPPPPWHPTFSAGYGSFTTSTAPPPYPLDTSSTASSLFSDYTDIASAPILPEVSKEPLFREQRSMSYSTENDAAITATPAYYYKNGLDPWNYYHSDNQGKYHTNSSKKTINTNNGTNNLTGISTCSASLYTMPEESTDRTPFTSPLNTPFFDHHNRNNSYRDDNIENDDKMNPGGGDNDDDDDTMLAAFYRTRSKSSAPAFDIWYPSSDTSTDLKSRWLYQPSSNHQHGNSSLYTPFLSATESQRSASLRRFSVQPSSRDQLSSLQIKDSTSDSLASFSRRHSMAGPALHQQQEEHEEDTFSMANLENSIDELTKLPSAPPPPPIATPTTTTTSTTESTTSSTTPTTTSSPIPSASTLTKATTNITTTTNKAVPPTSAKDLYAKVAAAGISDSTSTATTTPTTAHPPSHGKSTPILPTSSPAATMSVSSSSSSSTRHTLPKSETMGKGVKWDSIAKDMNYFIVEFKARRTDVYFSPLAVKAGDLVMVEADRGHDLGKVVIDSITPSQLINYTHQQQQQQQQQLQLELFSSTSTSSQQQQDTTPGPLTQQQRGDIRIKRLLRLAHPEEIALLVAKNEDELKALETCQVKVQQRKLNIKVVNAEFQMDRRKLIFYFISEKRVDFRELVRDLFKIYKTRIWMCAVHKTIKNEDISTT